MKFSILKCHGSNNDFILIDEISGVNTNIPECRRADIARTLCDRETGIGADGVLFYLTGNQANCRMRMFNPDGTEAEMCGNGLRCVGRYGAEQLGQDKITVETSQVTLAVWRGMPIFDGVTTFEAEIAPVSLAVTSLPMESAIDPFIDQSLPELSDRLKFTALSMPNPHIVTFVDDIDETQVIQCGTLANNHMERFPRGINVSFVRPLGDNRLFVVTYERGAGITNACGTAMSASAYVAAHRQVLDRTAPVTILNKGGMMAVCDVSQAERVILKGNATFVFTATVDMHKDCLAIDRWEKTREYNDEATSYEQLQAYARSIVTVAP